MKIFRVLLLCITLGAGCHLIEVQWVYADYPNGIEFIGMRKTEKAPTVFFSVRVKGDNGLPIPATCPLIFHWQGRDFPVSTITTDSVTAAGIDLQTQYGNDPDTRIAFIGGADTQNRDYGVEFHFRKNRIVEFYARYEWKYSVPCPFELSTSQNNRIRFPMSEDQLRKTFGKPESIIGVWGE